MPKFGKCEVKGLKDFEKKLVKLSQNQTDEFIRSCSKELAARLLAKVIERTPVGDYPIKSGKKGGTLRQGWTSQLSKGFDIKRTGDTYEVELINPTEYASYVEYGHRTADHKGWVEGKFILTIAEQELAMQAPQVLENKLQKYLDSIFK